MRFITLLARKANTTKNIAFTANTAKRNSYVSRLGFPRVSLGRNMKENCHARVNALRANPWLLPPPCYQNEASSVPTTRGPQWKSGAPVQLSVLVSQ